MRDRILHGICIAALIGLICYLGLSIWAGNQADYNRAKDEFYQLCDSGETEDFSWIQSQSCIARVLAKEGGE